MRRVASKLTTTTAFAAATNSKRSFGGSAFAGDGHGLGMQSGAGFGTGIDLNEKLRNFEDSTSNAPKDPQQRLNDIGLNTTGARARRVVPDSGPGLAGSDVSPGAQAAAQAMGINLDGTTELKDDPKAKQIAPLLFQVPTQSARAVGRDGAQLSMWQSLLAGRRVHVITGVDGIGKSCLAAEFADACRRNGRFTCIKWFDAQDALPVRIREFSQSVKGRREKDVLFIFDNVTDLAAVERWIPSLDNIFVVITTPVFDPATLSKEFLEKHKINLFVCGALDWKFSSEILSIESLEEDLVMKVCEYLGNAPILLKMASALLGPGEVLSVEELVTALEKHHTGQDGVISVSATLKMLMRLGLEKIKSEFGEEGVQALTSLACYNGKDLASTVVSALHERGDDLAATAAAVGLVDPRWESDGWTMHASIATALRDISPTPVAQLAEAAAASLLAAWPRRMRGDGATVARNLVQHADALQKVVPDASGTDTLQLLLKVANFLTHTEGAELQMATRLYQTIFDVAAKKPKNEITDDDVTVGQSLGLLLLRLKDPKCEAVLRQTVAWSAFLHGEGSVTTATLVASLSGFLEPTPESINLLHEASSALYQRVKGAGSHSEDVLSVEEQQHLKRSLFGVLLRIAQLTEQMGGQVSTSDWNRLEGLHKELQQ